MSSQIVETPIASAKSVSVMVYDEANKKWQPSGSGPGLAKVQLFQHVVNNTYRVVGRKHVDHEVVINCQITKDLRYNQANETFLQWRNAKQVYGLNFQSSTECESFAQVLKLAVDNLCKGPDSNGDRLMTNGKRQASESNGFYDTDRHINGSNGNNSHNLMRNVVSSPQLIANNGTISSNHNHNHHHHHQIPIYNMHQRKSSDLNGSYGQQQQQHHITHATSYDQSQKIYDVIPDINYPTQQNSHKTNGNTNNNSTHQQSTCATVAPTPPPPPPPPPAPPLPKEIFSMPNDSNQRQSVNNPSASKIQLPPPGPPPLPCTLDPYHQTTPNSVKKPSAKTEEQPANRISCEQPKQMDFLTEIRMKLEKKNMENNNDTTSPNGVDEYDAYKPSNLKKTQINMKQNVESPKPLKKDTNGHTNGTQVNGHVNGCDNLTYDKLKQELLTDIRKEIQIMKSDIIGAIVSELRRNFN